MAIRAVHSGWMVEHPGVSHGNWDLIAANAAYDLIHLCRPAALRISTPEIWVYQCRIRASSFHAPFYGASLILTDAGTMEVVAASESGALAHFSFADSGGWQGPVLLPGRAAGPPAFIHGCFGPSGNFEVIVPRPSGGLAHFWRDNDASQPWREAATPVPDGNWSGVALIHSSYGNLEFVGVCDGELRFHWQAGAGGPWSLPLIIARNVLGRPALIQSSFGQHGNFEVVASLREGGLVHFWRNNTDPHLTWSCGPPFREGLGRNWGFDDLTMLQSTYGRLELIARSTDGRFWHFRGGTDAPWEGPIELLVPRAKYDE